MDEIQSFLTVGRRGNLTETPGTLCGSTGYIQQMRVVFDEQE